MIWLIGVQRSWRKWERAARASAEAAVETGGGETGDGTGAEPSFAGATVGASGGCAGGAEGASNPGSTALMPVSFSILGRRLWRRTGLVSNSLQPASKAFSRLPL